VFFITFSYAIIGQYEAIEEIAKYIGHDDKLEAGKIILTMISEIIVL